MGHTDNADMHYISMNIEEHRRRYTEGYQSLRIFEPSESGQMKVLEKKLTDANKTIEELQQQVKKKDESVVNLQSSLSALETRVKPLEDYWKYISKLRTSKTIRNKDGSRQIQMEETET
jgi:predicted  nucleic acid-binding Zn-ribbon protein